MLAAPPPQLLPQSGSPPVLEPLLCLMCLHLVIPSSATHMLTTPKCYLGLTCLLSPKHACPALTWHPHLAVSVAAPISHAPEALTLPQPCLPPPQQCPPLSNTQRNTPPMAYARSLRTHPGLPIVTCPTSSQTQVLSSEPRSTVAVSTGAAVGQPYILSPGSCSNPPQSSLPTLPKSTA